MDVIGDKARGLMQRQVGDLFSNVIVDATKQPLTFGTASALAEQVAKDNEGKAHIVYNRFVSAISFKPTIATVLSGEEYEKAAENLENKFDSYEVEDLIVQSSCSTWRVQNWRGYVQRIGRKQHFGIGI